MPGKTRLPAEGGRFLMMRRVWRRRAHKPSASWFKSVTPEPGEKCVLCGNVHVR